MESLFTVSEKAKANQRNENKTLTIQKDVQEEKTVLKTGILGFFRRMINEHELIISVFIKQEAASCHRLVVSFLNTKAGNPTFLFIYTSLTSSFRVTE